MASPTISEKANWHSETTVGSHQFIIRGYSTLKTMASKDFKESSDVFTIGGYKWVICFFPNRDTWCNDSSGGSVYIGFVGGPTVAVRVSFEIKILDQSGSGKHIVFSCFRILNKLEEKARRIGVNVGNIADCVKDDCLVIQCVIGVSSTIEIKRKFSDQVNISSVSGNRNTKPKLSSDQEKISRNCESIESKPMLIDTDRKSAVSVKYIKAQETLHG